MRTLFALAILALALASSGCKTVPKNDQESQDHTPYSERPETTKDYWDQRSDQDRRENRQEAPPKAP